MAMFAALSIFSLLGFTIGFLAYLAHPTVSSWIINSVPSILVSQAFVGAVASGAVGLIVTMIMVTRWARKP